MYSLPNYIDICTHNSGYFVQVSVNNTDPFLDVLFQVQYANSNKSGIWKMLQTKDMPFKRLSPINMLIKSEGIFFMMIIELTINKFEYDLDACIYKNR